MCTAPGGRSSVRAAAELKPDVCWQLPLRREDAVDDRGHVTTTVTEWDGGLGRGGERSSHWWCTDAPEAFRAGPVYRTLAAELRALVGERVLQPAAAATSTSGRWRDDPAAAPGGPSTAGEPAAQSG